jgi:diacylglycerol kinase (ATP)
VTAKPTPGPASAAALAKQSIGEGCDLVIGFGGDGTINEVAAGVAGTRTPLAILPGGTANVLCRELCVGLEAERAVALIGESSPERIAMGVATCDDGAPRRFLAMAGVGFDAHIVYRMNADLKKKWGKLAYWISGFGQIVRQLEEFDAEIDGVTHRCSFALVTKVRNYGGDLQIARRVSILDDRFEIVLFAGRNTMRYVKYLTGIAVNRLEGMEGVTILRARRAQFRCPTDDRVYVQVDGEYVGRLPATVEIEPDALTLLIPPAYRDRDTGYTSGK